MTRLRSRHLFLVALLGTASPAFACDTPVSVCGRDPGGSVALIRDGTPATVFVEASADPAVKHVAESFRADLGRVAGREGALVGDLSQAKGAVVIIGEGGKSAAIDALIRAGKIDAKDLAGQWEGFRQVVVDKPFAGVDRALVIVGSDRRGAVFGAYDLSEKMGVSAWHWWADVPVQTKVDLFVTSGARADAPKVKYRGFFINDEEPALGPWVRAKFGGFNAKFYEHVFELTLRLKGNYLWPAMWAPKAFNDDDPQNMVLADQMGVVMGTSHHEPMTRAQDEWHRHKEGGVTGGKWDYATNADNLRSFWRGGIERMMSKGDGEGYEALVTVGMRGDGDEPMSEGTAIELLEKVVTDQRSIIADVTKRPASETPQVWALYKEVQDYYDHGMKVPDDVTLLYADDNWGQIRRLPVPGQNSLDRPGGYGVYYHFDYVGGPRNYKWLNTNQIEKTWQQMDLAYRRGARALWIVNVGDIKPMEYPLDFFMKQAWDPEGMTPEALAAYPKQWAAQTFGEKQSGEIGALVTDYSRLAARRKPELIDPSTFPLGHDTGAALDGGVFGAMVDEWRALVARTAKAKAKLRPDQQDAYFQLVEHPVLALSNLYELYYAVAWNRRLAAAGDARANRFADLAEAAYARDAELTEQYHKLGGGKWDGMMNQIHMGYTIWQTPEKQVMPEVKRLNAPGDVPAVRFAKPTAEKASVVSIDAASFTRALGGKGLTWVVVPNLGPVKAGVVALPQGQAPTTPEDNVRLDYDVTVPASGDLKLRLQLAPTVDTIDADGMKIGVSVDDGPVQLLNNNLIPVPGAATRPEEAAWSAAVTDNAHFVEATFPGVEAGKHKVSVWRIDDNVVLQRIELSAR